MAAPDAQTHAAPLTVWLTSRTTWETGFQCPRRRYLGMHSGPSGYGLTSKSESLPLATGKYVHSGIEAMTQILRHEDTLPSEIATRAIVRGVQTQYEFMVAEKGFRGILAGPQTDITIKEQSALISGLLWALRLKFLPWLHAEYRILEAEQERLHFLTCTCGSAPLDTEAHLAKGCSGIALMIRSDILAQQRTSGRLAYFEVKTTGWAGDSWAEQWETKPQLGLGTLDIEAKYGQPVSELYIVGLNKGKRARRGDDPQARKVQESALCSGYCRPSNPPLQPDEWVPAYEWKDAQGATRRKTKQHERRGVWELVDSDWPTWTAFHNQSPEMTPEEFWVRQLPQSILDQVCFLIGPMQPLEAQISSLRKGMAAEEGRWRDNLWRYYEEPTPDSLDALFPQSWQCRPFGKEHQCEFVPLCFKFPGWEDPLGSGKYALRKPHHEPELAQMRARGYTPADWEEADNEDAS